MSEYKKLFDQFPPVPASEWMDKIVADLKGADFTKSMVWRPVEGFSVMPFYRAEDIESLPFVDTLPGQFPFLRGGGKSDNNWFVREDIIVADVTEANNRAISVLGRGADSICFRFSPEQQFSTEMLEKLIDSIYLEAIEINFAPQGSALELLRAFKETLKKRGTRPALIRGAVETDPLGRMMVKGKLCITVEEGLDYLAELVKEADELINFRVLSVNGSNFGNAGSDAVQELAMTLAMGNEYMSQLTSRGIGADQAARATGFTFSIGSSYFIEIAKLRAARMLWAAIVKKYSPQSDDSMKMNIHSVTGEWNKTTYDPYVNMLRTQTEAMSATLGGADSLTVNPFDKTFAVPGEFSERIARNQQLLLKEESHFDKIADPAAGSYYIENLTASMAENAWDLFLKIEEKGGFLEALKEGFIQSQVRETRKRRKADLSKGKEKLLGTNIFPNLDETSREETINNIMAVAELDKTEVEPLIPTRGAREFEMLRMATEKHGKRPVVFMLTIGNPVMRKARSQFSSNFFAVAGYRVIDNSGFGSLEEGTEAALKAGADIIVLCSSDEEYEMLGPSAIKIIGGRAILVIAGAPACSDQLKEAGIEYFINMRSDILATLQMFNSLLGIKEVAGNR